MSRVSCAVMLGIDNFEKGLDIEANENRASLHFDLW